MKWQENEIQRAFRPPLLFDLFAIRALSEIPWIESDYCFPLYRWEVIFLVEFSSIAIFGWNCERVVYGSNIESANSDIGMTCRWVHSMWRVTKFITEKGKDSWYPSWSLYTSFYFLYETKTKTHTVMTVVQNWFYPYSPRWKHVYHYYDNQ